MGSGRRVEGEGTEKHLPNSKRYSNGMVFKFHEETSALSIKGFEERVDHHWSAVRNK